MPGAPQQANKPSVYMRPGAAAAKVPPSAWPSSDASCSSGDDAAAMAAAQWQFQQQQHEKRKLTASSPDHQRHFQQQLFLALKRKEGVLLDVQSAIVGLSHALDAFKGLLLALMVFSQVVMLSSTPSLRESCPVCLWLCNAAAVLCPSGFMVVFGYTCYSQHLRDWTDTPPSRRLLQLARAAGGPLISGWICNFAQHFAVSGPDVHPRSGDGFATEFADVLSVDSFLGVGPDIMIACSVNFILVFTLWDPIRSCIEMVPAGVARDIAFFGLALLPVSFTQVEFVGCGDRRWLRHLAVCADEGSSSRGQTVPALPYLLPFSLGLLLAGCWDRFYSELQPVVNGDGPMPMPASGSRRSFGSLHLVPFRVARIWVSCAACCFAALALFFTPLGQIWGTTDFSSGSMAADYHHAVFWETQGKAAALGSPGRPSAVWLFGSLWPVAVLGSLTCLLVAWSGRTLGAAERHPEEVPWLPQPVAELEHLGVNLLYYVTFLNVLLAGATHVCVGADRGAGAAPLCEGSLGQGAGSYTQISVIRYLLGSGGVLMLGRFLFAVASLRK